MKYAVMFALLTSLALGSNAKTVTIGIDLSGSNPLLSHVNFAHMASEYVSNVIAGMKNGDVVRIKTFGARDEAVNILNADFEISRRVKPEKVAAAITQYLRSLPSNEGVSQGSTNLIAWLEFTSGFNCRDNSVILVITDGLESSSYVDGGLLLQGKKGLPEPDAELSGCALTFYGLGAGWPPRSVKFVRSEWRNWSEKAGASFTAIIP